MEDLSQYPKIEQDDLNVGDVIIAINKNNAFEHEAVETVKDRDGDLETAGAFYSPRTYDFYLVKRAPFVLPTKKGSVVKVSNGSLSANWLLRQDGKWHSEDTGSKNPVNFQRFIAAFNAEVIA